MTNPNVRGDGHLSAKGKEKKNRCSRGRVVDNWAGTAQNKWIWDSAGGERDPIVNYGILRARSENLYIT